MGVIGSAAGGYATVTPNENYVGQAIQNIEENGFKYREERRKALADKDARDKAKQDAIDKGIEYDLKDADEVNKIDAKPSGFTGMDAALKSGLGKVRPIVIENRRLYRQTGDKKYLDASMAAMSKLKTIAGVADSYAEIAKRTEEGVANGTIDEEERERILKYSKRLESGDIEMDFDGVGNPFFNAYEISPENGKRTDHFLKNIPGEEIVKELSPTKTFDYTKQRDSDIKGLGEDVENIVGGKVIKGVPNVEKKIIAQVNSSLANDKLVKQLAKYFNIPIDEKTGITPEIKALVAEKYGADLLRAKNTSIKPDYEGARLAESKREHNKAKDTKNKPFTPPTSTVIKGGKNNNLGMDISKGERILSPTYEKGKEGSIKGVVLNSDGVFRFSILTRKDDTLNAQGIANKAAFQANSDNKGKEYEPIDSDYKFSTAKPTVFVSGKDDNILDEKVRGMLNPTTGEYFQNFNEYKEVYNKYTPKKVASRTNKSAPTQKATAVKKVYGGVDENGKIIWK